MTDYVRVRDKETGHHYSVPRSRFDATPELWQELKQPATDRGGMPLPPKFKRDKGGSARPKKPVTPDADPAPDQNGQTAGSEEGEN